LKDSKIDNIINDLSKQLKQKYPAFRGIYFFGSRTKGKFTDDSDYDIVITFDQDIHWKFEADILNIVFDYMLEYDIIIDCHVYNHSEVLNPATPFRANVKNEGIFYGA
jgi:predicted nucleotidyltransferase